MIGWFLLCLYAACACYVLVMNATPHARWRVVLADAWAALIWPLVLLPWREWLASQRPSSHRAVAA